MATWLAEQQLDNLCQAQNSVEVARCKDKLDFKPKYDALEVTRSPRVAVTPTRPAPQRVAPSPPRPRRGTMPEATKPVSMAPVTTAQLSVDPTSGQRKWSVMPVSHRRAPTDVRDL